MNNLHFFSDKIDEIIQPVEIEGLFWAHIPDGTLSEDDEEDMSADEEVNDTTDISASPAPSIFIVHISVDASSSCQQS